MTAAELLVALNSPRAEGTLAHNNQQKGARMSIPTNSAPCDRIQNIVVDTHNNRALFALAVLFCINLLNFFDRQIFGALAEPIRKEFQLSDATLGLLGTAFTLFYAVAGLPLGRISDRWSRARLLAIGTAVWSVFTAATSVAQNFTQLFLTRLGVGIGEATCAPAGQSLVGDLFPHRQRARAMAIFMLGAPAGGALAYYFAGAMGSAWGWRAVFLIAAVPGLVLAVVMWRITEPRRDVREPRPGHWTHPAAAVLKIPTMWWITLSGIFHNFNMFAINSFHTPLLQRFHGMSLADANNVSAITVSAIGVVGMLGGGWVADKFSTPRRSRRMLIGSISMAVAAPCILLALSQPPGAISAFAVYMAIATTCMCVYYPTVYSAIQDVVPPHLRGTAVAMYFCALYVLGASLGPLATGILSDHFAQQAMHAAGTATMSESFKAIGLHSAMYAVPLLVMLTSIALFFGTRTMDKDASICEGNAPDECHVA